MRYTTVQRLISAANTQARAAGTNIDARMAVYIMALTSLSLTFSEADPGTGALTSPHGWERMTEILANPRERLPVDALESGPLETARRRLDLIAEIPEISGVATHEELVTLIGEAINRGAPRYNSGDTRGCAAIYWTFARLICETPATRGFPGYARLQADLKPLAETPAYPDRMSDAQADSWAWELRRALDAAARNGAA